MPHAFPADIDELMPVFTLHVALSEERIALPNFFTVGECSRIIEQLGPVAQRLEQGTHNWVFTNFSTKNGVSRPCSKEFTERMFSH